MKKAAGFLFLMAFFCSCSAQTYRVQKAQAFFTVSMPGAQMVDDKGNPVAPQLITERFIYIESNYKGNPQIDSVIYGGKSFIPAVADKEEISLTIGVKKDNGQALKLRPKIGNQVWKINVDQSVNPDPTSASVKKIIIKGKLGKTDFKYTLNGETELEAPLRY